MGLYLPTDYKQFIEHYGSGTIGDFLSVLNPFSSKPTLNLKQQANTQLDALRRLAEDFDGWGPYNFYPAEVGLLPVSITDNGDIVHWLTEGPSDSWSVVVNESRSPDHEKINSGLVGFLLGVLSQQVTCRAFPIDVFEQDTCFESC